ncbi:MAG: sulfotransferase family 2 domain-containing protein, partial [Novosphingobium sp.]
FESHLERLRAYHRAALMKRVGVAFVHVPRTAGSSISHLLYHRFIGHFPVHALDALDDQDVQALPRFAVVRNPWDRLASAYRFAVAGGGKGPLAAKVAPHVAREVAKAGSFERFVKEWLPARAAGSLDGVFRPQTYYLCNERDELPFDHLGKLSQLYRTEEWLSDILRQRIRLPRANETPENIVATRYDGEMIDITAKIYKPDFVRLDY